MSEVYPKAYGDNGDFGQFAPPLEKYLHDLRLSNIDGEIFAALQENDLRKLRLQIDQLQFEVNDLTIKLREEKMRNRVREKSLITFALIVTLIAGAFGTKILYDNRLQGADDGSSTKQKIDNGPSFPMTPAWPDEELDPPNPLKLHPSYSDKE